MEGEQAERSSTPRSCMCEKGLALELEADSCERRRGPRGRFWQSLSVSRCCSQVGTDCPLLWAPPSPFPLRGLDHWGRLHSGSCGPASCPPTPLSTLRRCRGTDAGGQAHLQADGKDCSCWRGPRSVCLLHSDQLRGPARCASPARVQGSRPQGKPSSSAPASAPRTTSTSGELACSLGPQTPDPPAPTLLFAPSPGPFQPWA